MQSNFLSFDQVSMRLITDTKTVWNVPFALCVSAFLFLSAIAHFIISAPGTNAVYNRGLETTSTSSAGMRCAEFFGDDRAHRHAAWHVCNRR